MKNKKVYKSITDVCIHLIGVYYGDRPRATRCEFYTNGEGWLYECNEVGKRGYKDITDLCENCKHFKRYNKPYRERVKNES